MNSPKTTTTPREERGRPAPRHGRDLTTGSIPRLLIAFAVPLLIGNAIQAAYTIVNRIWVGQYLGSDALAAITISMQITFILVAVANGLTLGSSILIAQFVGAKNWPGVRRVVHTSIVLIGVLSVVLLIAGQCLTIPLLRVIHTPPNAFPLAAGYMRLFLFSFPLIFVAILTTFLLRGVGDSMTPLIFQGIGVVITAILDPLLMLGWLGFPRMGLNGTAVAMLIAQSLTIVAFFIYLHRKQHVVSPDWRHLRADWGTCLLTLKIGLPAAAQQLLVSLGSATVLLFINDYHESATAGFGAASQIDMIAFFLAMSLSMAISTLAGQNIGAKRFDRVHQTFRWGILFSVGSVLVVSLLAVTWPGVLMRMFINPVNNPAAFQIGIGYLRIVGASYICFGVMFACVGVINGAGHTLVSTLQTVVSLWLVRLPLAYYLSHLLHSVVGIWYALAISFAVSMLISLAYYFSGRWKRGIMHPAPLSSPADAGEEDLIAGPLLDNSK